MPGEDRRQAKRPRVFALIFVAVAALSAAAVAALAERPKAVHIEQESGRLP